MNAILVYCRRDLIRWVRGKWGFISTMITPAAWLLFVGLALPIRFTDNYIDFITPGILVMTMLSAAMSGGGLLIMDRMLGFFNKFLALPPPRETILYGKILVTTIRGMMQATIILIFSVLLGAAILNPVQLLLTYGVLMIFGCLLSAFSTTLAIYVGDHDNYAAVNAMITMPLFFTSSAMMPYDVMPDWMRTAAMVNPLSIAIDAIREVKTGIFPFDSFGILLLLTGMMLLVSVTMFRRIRI